MHRMAKWPLFPFHHNTFAGFEVPHDRRLRIPLDDVENIRVGHAVAAELCRVRGVGYLEHVAADVSTLTCKEPLDVVPVDALATIEPEQPAHRRRASQRSPANGHGPQAEWDTSPSHPSHGAP